MAKEGIIDFRILPAFDYTDAFEISFKTTLDPSVRTNVVKYSWCTITNNAVVSSVLTYLWA